jgi:hypothetical protein
MRAWLKQAIAPWGAGLDARQLASVACLKGHAGDARWTSLIKVAVADAIAVVTMDHPPVNAQNAQFNGWCH